MKRRLFAASLLLSFPVVAGIGRAWSRQEGRGGTAMSDAAHDLAEDRRVRKRGVIVVLAVIGRR